MLNCGDLLEVVAVMPRGQTLVKSTPPPLGARGGGLGLKTQVRTIVGVPRPRVALAVMLLLLPSFKFCDEVVCFVHYFTSSYLVTRRVICTCRR